MRLYLRWSRKGREARDFTLGTFHGLAQSMYWRMPFLNRKLRVNIRFRVFSRFLHENAMFTIPVNSFSFSRGSSILTWRDGSIRAIRRSRSQNSNFHVFGMFDGMATKSERFLEKVTWFWIFRFYGDKANREDKPIFRNEEKLKVRINPFSETYYLNKYGVVRTRVALKPRSVNPLIGNSSS